MGQVRVSVHRVMTAPGQRWFYRVWLVCALTILPIAGSVRVAAQTDFDILGGAQRVQIPFQYTNNFILVDVRMFGILPMSFIFDTGAEHTILFKREYTDVFNVRYDLRVPIIGSDMSREIYALVTRSVTLEVAGMEPVRRDILVLEEDYLNLDEITGRKIHGILGSSFFRNAVVQIDYRKNRIVLHNPSTFHKPGSSFQVVEMTVRSGKPYIPAQVTLQDDTELEVVLLVDTGAGLPLLLHNNTNEKLHLPDTYILGKLGLGLGGYVEGYLGRIKSLCVGELPFPQMLTSFQDLTNTVLGDSTRFRNGLMGNQLLSRFHIYLDYLHETMYIRPRPHYNKHFRMDKSGLVIFATGPMLNTYVVQDTLSQSPASEADIRPGDIIRKLQGLPADYYTMDDVVQIFQRRKGKHIRLVIERDNTRMRKRFALRELI